MFKDHCKFCKYFVLVQDDVSTLSPLLINMAQRKSYLEQ